MYKIKGKIKWKPSLRIHPWEHELRFGFDIIWLYDRFIIIDSIQSYDVDEWQDKDGMIPTGRHFIIGFSLFFIDISFHLEEKVEVEEEV